MLTNLTFHIFWLILLLLQLYPLSLHPLLFPMPRLFSFADGCPNLCNGNGQCTMGQNSWHCECKTGWRGTGCNVAMETSCADNKDNEGGQTTLKKPAELTFTITKYLFQSFFYSNAVNTLLKNKQIVYTAFFFSVSTATRIRHAWMMADVCGSFVFSLCSQIKLL